MRKITFPRIWPARAVGSRTLPVTLQPGPVTAVAHPLPPAGGGAISSPYSHSIIDRDAASPGRGYIGGAVTPMIDLDSGAAPNRIDRLTTARNAGAIGRGVSGWPYDGNALLVPHTMIPRYPITVTPFARTIDTGVTIPTLPIGGPVG